VPQLKSWLTLSTHKLSAAGSLALLHEPDGIAVLKEALVARDPEPRMRAAAALGYAGDDTGKALLLEMIADPRYDQLAATALARLGERAAEPVLTRVLVLSSLSVEAAIGLRRLGADVDLTALAGVLEHGDEIARIEAAEAVIVLCDPKPPMELR
jgi:HEAT repeat protein